MISYEPFWKTLKKRNVSTYKLINKHKIASSTLTRLRNNKPITTTTIDDLCSILNCRVQDVIEYIKINK